jgi:ribokinase
MKDIDAVGFGALNIDRLIRVKDLESKDSEMIALGESATPGGSAANSIYALAKLGLRTAYMGAVSDDFAARVLLESFEKVNINTNWIHEYKFSPIPTGEALCVSDEYGRRLIILRSGANAHYTTDNASFALSQLIPRSRLLHLTSFVDAQQLETQHWLVKRLPNNLILTFSPGALYVKQGLPRIEEVLTRCQYVFFNRHEITTLMDLPDVQYEQAAYKFMSCFPFCKAVVVTLGRGTETKEADYTESKPIGHTSSMVLDRIDGMYKVTHNGAYGKVLDTIGAGDAYAAGFIYGILKGCSSHDCAIWGHVLAQFSVLSLGARDGIPNFSELIFKYQEHKEHLNSLCE